MKILIKVNNGSAAVANIEWSREIEDIISLDEVKGIFGTFYQGARVAGMSLKDAVKLAGRDTNDAIYEALNSHDDNLIIGY